VNIYPPIITVSDFCVHQVTCLSWVRFVWIIKRFSMKHETRLQGTDGGAGVVERGAPLLHRGVHVGRADPAQRRGVRVAARHLRGEASSSAETRLRIFMLQPGDAEIPIECSPCIPSVFWPRFRLALLAECISSA